MKETEKTILSRIDDEPNVDWKELSGDEMKEIILQTMWDDFRREKNLEAVDIQDKKTCISYGRPTKKIVPSGGFYPDVYALDIYDVLYDPMMNPVDVQSARFIIHQNIFRSVRECLADKRYTEEGKKYLRAWIDSKQGIISSQNSKKCR